MINYLISSHNLPSHLTIYHHLIKRNWGFQSWLLCTNHRSWKIRKWTSERWWDGMRFFIISLSHQPSLICHKIYHVICLTTYHLPSHDLSSSFQSLSSVYFWRYFQLLMWFKVMRDEMVDDEMVDSEIGVDDKMRLRW